MSRVKKLIALLSAVLLIGLIVIIGSRSMDSSGTQFKEAGEPPKVENTVKPTSSTEPTTTEKEDNLLEGEIVDGILTGEDSQGDIGFKEVTPPTDEELQALIDEAKAIDPDYTPMDIPTDDIPTPTPTTETPVHIERDPSPIPPDTTPPPVSNPDLIAPGTNEYGLTEAEMEALAEFEASLGGGKADGSNKVELTDSPMSSEEKAAYDAANAAMGIHISD